MINESGQLEKQDPQPGDAKERVPVIRSPCLRQRHLLYLRIHPDEIDRSKLISNLFDFMGKIFVFFSDKSMNISLSTIRFIREDL